MKKYKGVNRDLINKCLQMDRAKSAAAMLTSKEGSPPCTLIGSWTVFNTKISDVETCKSEIGFLPVIPPPPKDNVCKCYLEILLNMKNDQNLSNTFCHNDHDVFYKLSQISIVNTMGCFHILQMTRKDFY